MQSQSTPPHQDPLAPRHCVHCGQPFLQKLGEWACKYRVRKTCSKQCHLWPVPRTQRRRTHRQVSEPENLQQDVQGCGNGQESPGELRLPEGLRNLRAILWPWSQRIALGIRYSPHLLPHLWILADGPGAVTPSADQQSIPGVVQRRLQGFNPSTRWVRVPPMWRNRWQAKAPCSPRQLPKAGLPASKSHFPLRILSLQDPHPSRVLGVPVYQDDGVVACTSEIVPQRSRGP